VLAGEGLTLWRGTTCLFEALSFALPAGRCLLIEGPNGAGKTSLLRILAGLTQPDDGNLTWHGADCTAEVRAGRLRLTFAGHGLALKSELTARANLEFFAHLAGTSRRVAEVLARTGVDGCADLEVRQLSAGQKRRVALGRVLLARAELWLLDEPQTNLDAAGRQMMEAEVRGHLAGGGTAIIAAHQSLDLPPDQVVRLRLGDA